MIIYNVISCLWVSFGNLAGPVGIFGGPVETSGDHLGLSGGIGKPRGPWGAARNLFAACQSLWAPEVWGNICKVVQSLWGAAQNLVKGLVREIVRDGCVEVV